MFVDSGPASSPKSLKSEASDDFEAEEHGFFPLDDEAYSSDFSIDEGDEGDTGADSTLSSLQSNDPGIALAQLSLMPHKLLPSRHCVAPDRNPLGIIVITSFAFKYCLCGQSP